MRHPENEYLLIQQRRREDRLGAEQDRLFKEAKAALRENRGATASLQWRWTLRPLVLVLARGLSFLGDHFITWSCRLQVRFLMQNGMDAENQVSPCR